VNPYQTHSATSKQAAFDFDFRPQCEKIYQIIKQSGSEGRTGKEIAKLLGWDTGLVSARLRDLQTKHKTIRKSDGIRDKGSIWKLKEMVDFEADSKRDRVAEALSLLEAFLEEDVEDYPRSALVAIRSRLK
jgi:hypothetical protein